MKNSSLKSIKEELIACIEEHIQENDLDITNEDDRDTAREEVTNLDYYIIGYYQAEKWLEHHNVTAWEAIAFVQEWGKENLGECRQYKNAEETANMIAYIVGHEAVYSMEVA